MRASCASSPPRVSLTRVCVVRVTREQKKNQESIASRLQLVIKSGKYTLGYRSTLKTLRSGKGALPCSRPALALAAGGSWLPVWRGVRVADARFVF